MVCITSSHPQIGMVMHAKLRVGRSAAPLSQGQRNRHWQCDPHIVTSCIAMIEQTTGIELRI